MEFSMKKFVKCVFAFVAFATILSLSQVDKLLTQTISSESDLGFDAPNIESDPELDAPNIRPDETSKDTFSRTRTERSEKDSDQPRAKPLNVFLMIGDTILSAVLDL
jgi:hypothetical protein